MASRVKRGEFFLFYLEALTSSPSITAVTFPWLIVQIPRADGHCGNLYYAPLSTTRAE
jgi:hypothetical protein